MGDREDTVVFVEDDRTGMSPETLRRAVLDHLQFTRAKDLRTATLLDANHALAHTARDRLVYRWMATQRAYADQDVKRVYYLSAEYLLGRQLGANLLNLGLFDFSKRALAEYGLDLDDILAQEPDPGLGNGGLGRLAACYMDSLAALQLPATGYGIRYEFGIFRQELVDGWQSEQPDDWLRNGNPWEIRRPEYSVDVSFGGHVVGWVDDKGKYHVRWEPNSTVIGIPYDTPVAGFGADNNTVNNLRLWSAKASREFDLAVFNDGDYRRAVEDKALTESISKVLYPKDDSRQGKMLRLKQQYFFVACSLHDILRRHREQHATWDNLPDKAVVQLNDTHPSIAVAELMRLLVDREGLEWTEAWGITQRTLAYTNHTLLPEALERWPADLFEELLPRHLEIIYEINRRFLREVNITAPGDEALKERMSIVQEHPVRSIRMAHLAVVGSFKVNGVAELHSQLLRDHVLRDFAELWPERFTNVTNGVTPRRWLVECNMRLSRALAARIGTGFASDLSELEQTLPLVDDAGWLEQLQTIKAANKRDLARYLSKAHGIEVDASTLFDVQVKRIHEYKRQLMCCLHVVHLYRRIKLLGQDIVPRTVFIGGKAAPGYATAKHHIKLINDVAAIINSDSAVAGRLKLVFLPNYNVSFAQKVIPAADLSEQISMAGKEASGTGNMKFQINGALTIGTLDGANVEIREEVGADNFFLFGLTEAEVREQVASGYDPAEFIEQSEALSGALDLIESGYFSPDDPDLHQPIVDYVRHHDPYLICADFESYLAAQQEVSSAFTDPARWWPMVAKNIAKSGKFSSDRSIRDYCDRIWGIQPVHVELQDDREMRARVAE